MYKRQIFNEAHETYKASNGLGMDNVIKTLAKTVTSKQESNPNDVLFKNFTRVVNKSLGDVECKALLKMLDDAVQLQGHIEELLKSSETISDAIYKAFRTCKSEKAITNIATMNQVGEALIDIIDKFKSDKSESRGHVVQEVLPRITGVIKARMAAIEKIEEKKIAKKKRSREESGDSGDEAKNKLFFPLAGSLYHLLLGGSKEDLPDGAFKQIKRYLVDNLTEEQGSELKEHLKEYTSKEGAAAMSRRKEGINNMQNGMAPSEAFQFPNELAPKVDEIYENLKSDQIPKIPKK